MVNIPKRDWVCAACSGRSNSLSFIEYSKNIADQPQSVLEFLKLPYATYNDFIKTNSEALTLFAGQISFNANKHKMVSKNLFTTGSILFVRSPDKNDWRLPCPCLTEKDYVSGVICLPLFYNCDSLSLTHGSNPKHLGFFYRKLCGRHEILRHDKLQ
jgi:hypothetical protein